MYDQLVQIITQFYPQDESKGIFLTSINGSAVIESVGCLVADRPWLEVLGKLYKHVIKNTIPATTFVCDIIISVEEVVDYGSLATTNHEQIWLALMSSDGDQIGVLLPATAWIQNLSQWLTYMKQKYNFQGMVGVYTITTDRKVVTIS